MDKYYSKTHEWVKITDDEEAIVGISEYAAKELLGDITYVELPKEGTDLICGDCAGTIESVTASSEVFSPVSGTVTAVNHALDDDASLINKSAEGKGWLYKLEDYDPTELEELIPEEDYAAYLETL